MRGNMPSFIEICYICFRIKKNAFYKKSYTTIKNILTYGQH